MSNNIEFLNQKLPLKLVKNGFTYIQILRIGCFYIYEQDYNSGIEQNELGNIPEVKCFEVFRANVRPEENIHGKDYPAREVFPNDKDFGYSAWSYRTLEKALEKLMKLKGHKK